MWSVVPVGRLFPFQLICSEAESGFRFSQLLRRDQVPDDDCNYLGRCFPMSCEGGCNATFFAGVGGVGRVGIGGWA